MAGLAAPLLSHSGAPGSPWFVTQRAGLGHRHAGLLATHDLCLSPWRGDIHRERPELGAEMAASGSESIFAKPGVTFCSLHPAPQGDLQAAQGSAWTEPSKMSSAPALAWCPHSYCHEMPLGSMLSPRLRKTAVWGS